MLSECLGQIVWLENQIKILENEGIDTSLIFRHEGMPSGQAYVIVDRKGENVILTYQTASLAIMQRKSHSQSAICDR